MINLINFCVSRENCYVLDLLLSLTVLILILECGKMRASFVTKMTFRTAWLINQIFAFRR